MPPNGSGEWLSGWRAAYSVLSIESCSGASTPFAVILLDIIHDQLLFRFRDDLDAIGDEESGPIIKAFRDELPVWASEEGGTSLYRRFLDTLSNSITITDARQVPDDVALREFMDRVFHKEIGNAGFARG